MKYYMAFLFGFLFGIVGFIFMYFFSPTFAISNISMWGLVAMGASVGLIVAGLAMVLTLFFDKISFIRSSKPEKTPDTSSSSSSEQKSSLGQPPLNSINENSSSPNPKISEQNLVDKIRERQGVVEWLRENITTGTQENINEKLMLLYQLRQYQSVTATEYKESWAKYDREWLVDSKLNEDTVFLSQYTNAIQVGDQKGVSNITRLLLEALLMSELLLARVETQIEEQSKDEVATIGPAELVPILITQPSSRDETPYRYQHFFYGISGLVKRLCDLFAQKNKADPILKEIFLASTPKGQAQVQKQQPWRWGLMHNHWIQFGLYGSYAKAANRMRSQERSIKEPMLVQRTHATYAVTVDTISDQNPLAVTFKANGGGKQFYNWTTQVPQKAPPSFIDFAYPDSVPP